MVNTNLPDIFLSYSTVNKHLAGQFKDCLEIMDFDVFLAHSTLVASTEWRAKIKAELERREVFIVLLTPKAKTSDWVDQEVGMAIALKKTIFPVQARGRIASGQAARRSKKAYNGAGVKAPAPSLLEKRS